MKPRKVQLAATPVPEMDTQSFSELHSFVMHYLSSDTFAIPTLRAGIYMAQDAFQFPNTLQSQQPAHQPPVTQHASTPIRE